MLNIPQECVRAFASDGAAVLPTAVAPAILVSLRKGATGLIHRFDEAEFESGDYWFYFDAAYQERILYRIHNLDKQDWPERELLFEPWLLAAAQAFIGAPAVPTAFALVLKQPHRGAEIPWHRDRTDVPPGTACNFSICLDDWAPGCGQLEWVPASHRLCDKADVLAARKQAPVADAQVAAGDILIHDVRLVHGSAHNRSAQWRRNIVIEYSPHAGRAPLS